MRVAIYSTKAYDRRFIEAANAGVHELVFLESRLSSETAVAAAGAQAVCVFVNDDVNAAVIGALHRQGTRLVALRCAGFNNVDLVAARDLGLTVCRVPEYSPYAVAEHTAALILALNRKIHRAYARVREGNFALEGLLGFDLFGKTVGVVGTGKIGSTFLRIMSGFGCALLAHDPNPDPACVALGVRYVDLETLLGASHVVSLHCPLTPATRHLIDRAAVEKMQRGAMLINTSRGGVVDTRALIAGQCSGTDRSAQEREARSPRPRRLRGGSGSVFRESVGGGPARRRLRASSHLPERAHHRAPGVFHERGAKHDREYDRGQHQRF
jgi:D-lactate dehydrogenase